MSRTYKHILKYKVKHYNWCQYPYAQALRNTLARNFITYDLNFCETRRKRKIENTLQKSFRQKIKRKLQKGDYDTLLRRQERSAWYVW